jgi:hypothetical protein
MQLLYYDLNP